MSSDDVAAIAAAITWPDRDVAQAARDRWGALDKASGSLGRLEDLGTWWAAATGECPPQAPKRPVLVLFAGDHGIAQTARTSQFDSETTARMVRDLAQGRAAANAIANRVGARLRIADVSVDAEPDYVDDVDPSITRYRVRRSSGSIDREDAMTPAETREAFAAGVHLADAEVDAGADLLIIGDVGIGNTTPAAAIIGLYAPADVVSVVGRGTGIDDAAWMRKCAAVRDAMRRGREFKGEPLDLLSAIGSPDFAAMLGFLLQAAARRTPVILDGVAPTAVALLAHRIAFRAREWWLAGHLSPEPGHTAALQRLDLMPVFDLQMRQGEGTGALLAIPVIGAAADALRELATFTAQDPIPPGGAEVREGRS